MDGPSHYREAERLLASADGDVSENWPVMTGERKADVIATAQVHATLALAAATAAARYTDRDPNGFFESTSIEGIDQWAEAAAPTTKENP